MSVKMEDGGIFMSETQPDLDILDEFLDRRLYDQEQQPLQQQSPSQEQKQQKPNQVHSLPLQENPRGDEDMFSAFLTDEINKNDYLFNGTPSESHLLGVDNFHIPDQPMMMIQQSVPMAQNGVPQLNQFPPPRHNLQSAMNSNSTSPHSVGLTPPHQDIFTTPTGQFPSADRSNSIGYEAPNPPSPYDATYESSRTLLSQLKFGRESPAQFNNEFPREYLDIDAAALPYQIRVENLPAYSRVETQIKLQLSVSPPPPEFLIHLPADTIAKQKLCLASETSTAAREKMLFLDAYVLTSSSNKPCNICMRCVRREQKRASRRKSGVSDNLNWMTNANKRAIIFNCKEVISFPAIPTAQNSKTLEISSRIVCYCRHHNESKGFKLLVVLTNASGKVVAKNVSSPIMIMDRKKNNEDFPVGANTGSNSANEASGAPSQAGTQPISPTSFEDDSSEPHTSDSRVFKRKRTWSPELSDGFSIAPSRKPSNTMKKEPISPQSQASLIDTAQLQAPQQTISRQPSLQANQASLPLIQRVIPSQGPLRGGIEVTLLGSNFKPGLTVKFGVNKALSTQCWSETTMLTYLPPSSQPGQVMVTIEDPQNENGPKTGGAIFTYLDDTDRQMIELALQIVGLKMNGKLEDARNIARKIIGSDGNGTTQDMTGSALLPGSSSFSTQSFSDEDLILKVINRLQSRPNWALCTSEGQTLLHLSALKGYSRLVSSMLQNGARVDYRDSMGYTPLHYAALSGDRKSIQMLINCKAKIDAKNDNGLTPEEVADANVLDMFRTQNAQMSRKMSNSSFTSSIFDYNEDELDLPGGQHVSRLTVDHLTDGTTSDAYDSDSDAEASNEESEDDWIRERDSSLEDVNVIPVQEPPTGTSIADASLWNKMRSVFSNSQDQEQLPRYDELFPLSAKQFSLPKLRFSSLTATDSDAGSSAQVDATNSSDEGEDMFMKFFNQRKNVQNDKMLIFFWLPLLIVIISIFILSNSGYTIDSFNNFQELVRNGVGKIMLGNERVKVALNKHFSHVNDAVTSVINAG